MVGPARQLAEVVELDPEPGSLRIQPVVVFPARLAGYSSIAGTSSCSFHTLRKRHMGLHPDVVAATVAIAAIAQRSLVHPLSGQQQYLDSWLQLLDRNRVIVHLRSHHHNRHHVHPRIRHHSRPDHHNRYGP